MAKSKTQFVCSECGADYSKWQGQCGECKAWNTLKEFREATGAAARQPNFQDDKRTGFSGSRSQIQKLSDVSLEEQARIPTGMGEFDRVLGGGLVGGSAVLIGGHPGAGKSTLLLQTLCHLARQLPVARKGLAGRQLATHDAISKLARDLLAQRLRIPGGQVEQQRKCITVHIRYIQ